MANATIGRAMGLIIKNVGGIRKGIEDMGTLGNPCKYSTVIAEREEENPWEPLHVEFGFNRDDSTITVFQPNAFDHIGAGSGNAKMVLADMVYNVMPGKVGLNLFLVAPDTAKALFEEGLTKKEVSEYIYEYARIPAYRFTRFTRESYSPTTIKIKSSGKAGVASLKLLPLNPMEQVRIFVDPGCIKIVVAGGPHTAVGLFGGLKREESHDWVTKKVTLPANWDKLVKKYKDLVPKYALY
jgi:hypothetical protein